MCDLNLLRRAMKQNCLIVIDRMANPARTEG
jgi:hypothetical protein